MTPDERNKLDQYLHKPFKALSTEEADYPLLKQILQKMTRLMNEGKLKLKSDKKRKAERDINGILDRNSLTKISTRCADVAMREKQILISQKMGKIKQNLAEYKEQTRRLKVRKARVEAHEAIKEQAYNEMVSRIGSIKKTIEKNVYSSMGKKIQIL